MLASSPTNSKAVQADSRPRSVETRALSAQPLVVSGARAGAHRVAIPTLRRRPSACLLDPRRPRPTRLPPSVCDRVLRTKLVICPQLPYTVAGSVYINEVPPDCDDMRAYATSRTGGNVSAGTSTSFESHSRNRSSNRTAPAAFASRDGVMLPAGPSDRMLATARQRLYRP